MIKNGILLFLFSAITTGTFAQGYTEHEQDSIVQASANDMCTCVNTIIEKMELPPRIMEMLYDYDRMSEEEVQEKFNKSLETATDEELEAIMEGARKMDEFDSYQEKYCEGMGSQQDMMSLLIDDFEGRLVEEMQKMEEKCTLSLIFYKLGSAAAEESVIEEDEE